MLAIFVERGGADDVQFAARQSRLEQISGVHRAFGFARADDHVHFIDEQYDVPGRLLDLVDHALEPLLEFAAKLGPGDERAHVEAHQLAILEAVGNVAIGDAQREPLGDRSLADPGLADQNGIILGAAGEHLDGTADLLVAADDGIQLAVARRLGEVARIFLERIVAIFGPLRVGASATAQLVDRGVEILRRQARFGEGVADRAALGEREGEQDPFDRDVGIAGLGGDRLGRIEQAQQVAVDPGRLGRAAAGDRRFLRH